MNANAREVERYRHHIRVLAEFLMVQSNNDLYIIDLIKDDDLPAFEQAMRVIIENNI